MSPPKITSRTRKGRSTSQSTNICTVSSTIATATAWAIRSQTRTDRYFERSSASFFASRAGNGLLLGKSFGEK